MSQKQLLSDPLASSFDGRLSLEDVERLEQPGTVLERLFPWLAIPFSIALITLVAVLPMTWQQQAVFGGLFILTAWILHRIHPGRPVTLSIAIFSLCTTARYGFWRSDTLYEYLVNPWQHASYLTALLMTMLLAAELYSFLILILGFMQTIVPLRRPVKPLPVDRLVWPTVDIMIPTYNEPLEIVRYTVLAAQEIDWPKDRLTITILDDGEREEFGEFAGKAGVGYIARSDHSGAKAGNLNNAIEQTLGDYVAIFDCDHVPTSAFLRLTMGWFLADADLALVQTPHHFYSPDPFERNLNQFRSTPNEGSLFYGVVQDANDLWNATFFCGSCAVIRRTALEEVGGIAQDTVTEDAHTSLRLQRAGWNTAYINIAQAAGLATETLAGHVRQRIRWARGMAQILRMDPPLFGRGLRLSQRLCYLNATLHYLYGIPRLLFLTAPLLYLFFGISNVPGYWAAILAFAVPHLLLSNLANSRIQGGRRHLFWNEIYETVLAPYIAIPTTVALIAPRHGTFNVTAKGGVQGDSYFDRRIATPFLILIGLNLAGIVFAIPRYLYWDHSHAGTIAINVFWTIFNMVILGTALAVCHERRQRRESNRVNCSIPVRLHTDHGVFEGVTTNVSSGGIAVKTTGQWKAGVEAEIEFLGLPEETILNARVCSHKAKQVRFNFTGRAIEDERKLTRVLFADPHRWVEWYAEETRDRPIRNMAHIVGLSLMGFWRALSARSSRSTRRLDDEDGDTAHSRRRGAAVAIILLTISVAASTMHGETVAKKSIVGHQQPTASGSVHTIPQSFTIGSVAGSDLLLQQPGSATSFRFTVPDTWFIQSGTLHLHYSIPNSVQESPPSDQSIADLRLNDTNLASIQPTQQDIANGGAELDIPLPAELLVRSNTLTIQLAGDKNVACTRNRQAVIPLRIDPASRIQLDATPLHITSDLRTLPHPFLEHLANAPAIIPVVFAHQPSSTVLQAAGVLASWFGVSDNTTHMHFPARVGSFPAGNAIVLLVGAEQIAGLPATTGEQGSVSLIDNPSDPYGKIVIVYGQTEIDLLSAVQALVLQQKNLSGSEARLPQVSLPAERNPDDAPRWIHSNRIQLSQLMTVAESKVRGADPVNLYMHLAPDYNFGSHQQLYLHLNYASDTRTLARTANITASLNGQTIDSYPMHPGSSPKAIDVPLTDIPMAAYANTLQLHFYANSFSSNCGPTNSQANSEVLGSSFIDMGGAVHQATMPNLKLFAKAGFPFTRIADLGDTAVLLPDNPSLEAVSFYLDLMSYFGSQTGYPALRVQVAAISQADEFAEKDLLVLGSFDDLGVSQKLNAKLPVSFEDNGASFGFLSRFGVIPKAINSLNFGELDLIGDNASHPADGLIAGFESPFAAGRSVVVALARENNLVPEMAMSMVSAMPADAIDESATIWNSNGFFAYPLLTGTYFVGTLPWYSRVFYSLSHTPLVLIGALLIVVCGIGLWASVWLGYRVRRRLRLFYVPIGETEPASSIFPRR